MRVFISGTAGFIGYHLAGLLLAEGHVVHGYDGMTDYYDVSLKQRRHTMLRQHVTFTATEALLEDEGALQTAIDACAPDVIVHLAAQAGVRYSLDNPRAYIDANIIGSFNVLEAARRLKVAHLLMASTSSVYGANTAMPYAETDKADTQMSFYAATKKANEAMAHAYAICMAFPPRCSGSLRSTAPGAARIWRCSSSPKRSCVAAQSTFTTTARCGAISPMSPIWCAASGY